MKSSNFIGLMTNREIAKTIADRFVSERKIKSWTQVMLSDYSGVNIATLRVFEQSGQISFENLVQLARTLGRLNIFDTFFDFEKEYQMLTYDEYQKIDKKSKRSYVKSP